MNQSPPPPRFRFRYAVKKEREPTHQSNVEAKENNLTYQTIEHLFITQCVLPFLLLLLECSVDEKRRTQAPAFSLYLATPNTKKILLPPPFSTSTKNRKPSTPSLPYSPPASPFLYLNTLQSRTGRPARVASLHQYSCTFFLSASETGVATLVQL